MVNCFIQQEALLNITSHCRTGPKVRLKTLHLIFKSLLFLDHESEFSRSDIVLNLWLSEAWFLQFPDFDLALNFKSQGTEKFELFSQGTYGSQNLTHQTLVIADYEYVKIFRVNVMDIKLGIKEDLDLHTNHLWSSFKFIHPKAQDLCKIFSSFSHNFISNIAKLKFLHIRN